MEKTTLMDKTLNVKSVLFGKNIYLEIIRAITI